MLRLRGVGKSYATPVLADVDLELQAGDVHALIGANGAGKSTLAKIISGLVRASTGEMTLAGSPYAPSGKPDAETRGVHIVQQELNLIEPLSVAENLFLNRLPTDRGFVDYGALNDRAAAALELVDLGDVDPRTPVSQLGVGRRQLVEIASALSRECRWLLLDEPTSALTTPQIERLFEHVRRLSLSGVGVIYISHRMEEIQQICDRATVLRDGRLIATREVGEFSLDEAGRLMVGAAPTASSTREHRTAGGPALRVEGLKSALLVDDITFEARRGEVVGIAGLVGSGRTELLRAIFGADGAEAGAVYVGGSREGRLFGSPSQAVRAGLAMTPEDRTHEGLLLSQPVRVNMTLGRVPAKLGWIDHAAERRSAQSYSDQTEIRCRSIEQPVDELSGGNQQKALIARWLMRDAEAYLFDEPTRGVDVGAKATIHGLLHGLAARDKGVVVVSSELTELMAICDRIIVMARGRLVAAFEAGDWSEERILAAALS